MSKHKNWIPIVVLMAIVSFTTYELYRHIPIKQETKQNPVAPIKQEVVQEPTLESVADTHHAPQHKEPTATKKRTITVHNDIEHKKLGYSKFGTHYPSLFMVHVNDEEVVNGNPATVTCTDNTLHVRYAYQFGRYRNGAEVIEFDLDPKTQEIHLAFNWQDDWRISIENATPIKRYTVPFDDVSVTEK